jgi:hypothetical protein
VIFDIGLEARLEAVGTSLVLQPQFCLAEMPKRRPGVRRPRGTSAPRKWVAATRQCAAVRSSSAAACS